MVQCKTSRKTLHTLNEIVMAKLAANLYQKGLLHAVCCGIVTGEQALCIQERCFVGGWLTRPQLEKFMPYGWGSSRYA
jgi:hypothetical protein